MKHLKINTLTFGLFKKLVSHGLFPFMLSPGKYFYLEDINGKIIGSSIRPKNYKVKFVLPKGLKMYGQSSVVPIDLESYSKF